MCAVPSKASMARLCDQGTRWRRTKGGASRQSPDGAVVKASLTDIKQGLFVGVTAMPQAEAASAHSRCTFSLRRCVGPEKDTTDGSSAQEHNDQRER